MGRLKLLSICALFALGVSCAPSSEEGSKISVKRSALSVPEAVQALANAHLAPTETIVSVSSGANADGDPVYQLVVRDTVSNEVRKFAVDDAGNVVDLEAIAKAARVEHEQLYGKLSKTLHEEAKARPNDVHQVAIIYETPPLPVRPSNVHVSGEHANHLSAIAQVIDTAGAQLAKDISSAGGAILVRAKYAPRIVAEMKGDEITGTLARHPSVAAARKYVRGIRTPTAEESTADLKLSSAFYSAGGYYGSGIKVGLTGERGCPSRS